MPRKPQHQPDDATRQTVQLHATVGTDQNVIARILGITKNTLRKYYKDELDLATAKANATVGGSLYKKATGYTDKAGVYHPPETAAQIFWMKTRAGWRETNRHEHTGADGGAIQTEDVTKRDADAFARSITGLVARSAEASETGEPETGNESGS